MATKPRILEPGGVDDYIESCPMAVRPLLQDLRKTIRKAAPGAIETVSYFDMPGYAYPGYDYHGMFAWFSFKAPYLRLHVRPAALVIHRAELREVITTKAIICFPADRPLPRRVIGKLVKSSIASMTSAAR